MSLIVFLDGIEISKSEHSSLDDAEINLRRSSTGTDDTVTFSFTSEIVFYGSAFLYLKNKLIDDVNARNNSIVLEIKDDCCKPLRTIYKGTINTQTIDFCIYEDRLESFCSITTDSLEYTSWNIAVECVKSN